MTGKYNAKRASAQAVYDDRIARLKMEERKLDASRKAIIGGAVISLSKRNPERGGVLLSTLAAIARAADRPLFAPDDPAPSINSHQDQDEVARYQSELLDLHSDERAKYFRHRNIVIGATMLAFDASRPDMGSSILRGLGKEIKNPDARRKVADLIAPVDRMPPGDARRTEGRDVAIHLAAARRIARERAESEENPDVDDEGASGEPLSQENVGAER